ncbi:hypothetical protein [Cyclobacterium jeungdonense]|uniref:HTH-like domain-containing protein n=1 Tax=Cyclobacterium jeungdonense TaxID=708087 RepID=A0ABT8C3B6_9BACT|nr:hypothetical protein [Cyclobacterium jeungdonense]MDN3687249.1 hypothetical protein [Cyclobacterium jeungdonense]
MCYYSRRLDDTEVIDKLTELAQSKPNRGFDWLHNRIRMQGHKWNRKRILRVYRLNHHRTNSFGQARILLGLRHQIHW